MVEIRVNKIQPKDEEKFEQPKDPWQDRELDASYLKDFGKGEAKKALKHYLNCYLEEGGTFRSYRGMMTLPKGSRLTLRFGEKLCQEELFNRNGLLTDRQRDFLIHRHVTHLRDKEIMRKFSYSQSLVEKEFRKAYSKLIKICFGD